MPEGLDQAREAFAQEVAPAAASQPRDVAGRFAATPDKPEKMFEPRPVEGGDDGDTRDGGPDPRLVDMERRAANGWDRQGNEGRPEGARPDAARHLDAAPGRQHGDEGGEPPEPAGAKADDAAQDDEGPDKGADTEGDDSEDTGPRYEIEVDGEKRQVSLKEALKGYTSEATFQHRMGQMVEVAKAIDQRGAEAVRTRDAYINLCRQQEAEFQALIPKEPSNWDELYKANPQAAHELEKNFRFVYGTLDAIRGRRQAAEQEAYQETTRRTAEYARDQFNRFCSKNKLTDQGKVDQALTGMRRTAAAHGFSEDEIGTTYDERMLSVLHKAAKYDNMMSQRPVAVQPERPLLPGSAPRVGNAQGRQMNDAQRRLAASGRVDDAAAVMAQLIRR